MYFFAQCSCAVAQHNSLTSNIIEAEDFGQFILFWLTKNRVRIHENQQFWCLAWGGGGCQVTQLDTNINGQGGENLPWFSGSFALKAAAIFINPLNQGSGEVGDAGADEG